MSEEFANLVPPLNAEQLKANEEFQREMRLKFAAPTQSDKYAYARRYVVDCLATLVVLQRQFETEEKTYLKEIYSGKSTELKLDCCQWLIALGRFAAAADLCPDENLARTYRQYLEAEIAEDSIWCEHPRYELVNGKRQPNFYREFDYFSEKRGKITTMTRCAVCDWRNATDITLELLKIDSQRQAEIEKELSKRFT